MDTENKVLVGFMAMAVIFFLSSMHTSKFEAERAIQRNYNIEAELDFEKDDDIVNIFDEHQQKIADFPNAVYSIVK